MADDGGGGEPRKEEKREKRRHKEKKSKSGDGEAGPAAAVADVHVLMENLLDKLKMLDYDAKFCKKFQLKPINRHYFAAASDASTQLHYFASLMSWLLSLAGKSFDAPDQYDDPNTICSNIVTKLKELKLVESMSQSALRSGCGEEIVGILSQLAQNALRAAQWRWEKPSYPHEANETLEEEDTSAGLEAKDGAGDEAADPDEIEDDLDDFDDDDVRNLTPPLAISCRAHVFTLPRHLVAAR